MIVPVLTLENQDKWLSSAPELSKRSLEKEIAKEFPERQVQERARYVSEKRIELKLGISEDLHEILKQVQDLVSTQNGKAVTLEDTLRAALELYVEKKDPQMKAERAEKRLAEKKVAAPVTNEAKIKYSKHVPGQVNLTRDQLSPKRSASSHKNSNLRFIPAHIEHAVRLRDRGQCTQKSASGQRCAEKRWLEIHHIQPLSQGGKTHLDNLTLICRGHHRVVHHH